MIDDSNSEEVDQDISQSFADEMSQSSKQEMESSHESKSASSARDNNNLEMLFAYGFTLTKQLEKLAAKYSEKVMKRSLEYLDECKLSGHEIQREAGWLTECLKNEWWRDSFKSKEEALILEGIDAMGLTIKEPEDLFGKLWLLVEGGYINPMPPFDGVVGAYLQVMDHNIYVDWYDPSFQQKQDQGIYQTMNLSEAMKRYHMEQGND